MEDINFHHRRLALEGNCVIGLTPIFPGMQKAPEHLERLKIEHYKKIDLSDAIFVVNKNGYIGEQVKKEIEYARAKGKEILFLVKPEP
jgi:hypothetical protein